MRARLLTATAVAAIAALAMPAHAAAKSKTLFFDNAGGCGTDSPVPVLDTTGGGGECNPLRLGSNGSGLSLSAESYATDKKAIGYKLDTTRKLTGTVVLVCTGVLSGGGNLPGVVSANVDVTVNGMSVGSTSGGGTITDPAKGQAIPLSFTLPKSLNGKVVKSIIATVKYTSGSGICGVSYSDPIASKLVVPTK